MYVSRIRGTAIGLAALVAAAPSLAAAGGLPFKHGSWQERRLLEPSAAEVADERDGKVFIYDGLEHHKVQQAMDQHFERIDNMMFVRTRHPPEAADEPETVEDDGCD